MSPSSSNRVKNIISTSLSLRKQSSSRYAKRNDPTYRSFSSSLHPSHRFESYDYSYVTPVSNDIYSSQNRNYHHSNRSWSPSISPPSSPISSSQLRHLLDCNYSSASISTHFKSKTNHSSTTSSSRKASICRDPHTSDESHKPLSPSLLDNLFTEDIIESDNDQDNFTVGLTKGDTTQKEDSCIADEFRMDNITQTEEYGLSEKTTSTSTNITDTVSNDSMNKRHIQYTLRNSRQKVDYEEKKMWWESDEDSPNVSDYIASPMSDNKERSHVVSCRNDKTSSVNASSSNKEKQLRIRISLKKSSSINKQKEPNVSIMDDESLSSKGSEFARRNKQWSIEHSKYGERDDFMVFLIPKPNINGRSIPMKGE